MNPWIGKYVTAKLHGEEETRQGILTGFNDDGLTFQILGVYGITYVCEGTPVGVTDARGIVGQIIDDHRKEAGITCDEHCWCWEAEEYHFPARASEQREMSLKEWCRRLPATHKANNELLVLGKVIALLNSMVKAGEQHSELSKSIVKEALSYL